MKVISIILSKKGRSSVEVNPDLVKSEIKLIQAEYIDNEGYALSFDAVKDKLYRDVLEAVGQVKEILDDITE